MTRTTRERSRRAVDRAGAHRADDVHVLLHVLVGEAKHTEVSEDEVVRPFVVVASLPAGRVGDVTVDLDRDVRAGNRKST
jgi:hypothetical protein